MGRRAHVTDSGRFEDFMKGIPDDARNEGYWLVYKDSVGKAGGVIREGCGHIPFDYTETHTMLRQRIFDAFVNHENGHGPGDYNALPCDANKKEKKGDPIVKFTFKKEECPMSNDSNKPSDNPVKDALTDVKNVQADLLKMKSQAATAKMLDKLLKSDDDEEEDVKETPPAMGSGLENMLLMRTLFDDKKKEDGINPQILQQMFESKMESKINELKASLQPKEDPKMERLLEKLVEAQNKPDDRFDKLLDRMNQQEQAGKSENAFQSMMAMMVQQQQGRDKERESEERRREDERKEERRREETERAEERRRADEERKLERERLDRDDRRREDERKAERSRLEDTMRLEREKFQQELIEQRRRFDEDSKIRREELKFESERGRQQSAEQQTYQLKLLELMKSSKDSSLDLTTKIVDTLTGAGLQSMKTAQEAATAIMSIAKQVDRERDKDKDEGGIGSILKDLAGIAGPILAPYASADAQMKMLQSIGNVAGQGGLEGLLRGLKGGGQATMPGMPQMPVMPTMPPVPRPQYTEAPAAGPSPAPKASKMEGGAAMLIVSFLQKFPDVKYALLGNLKRKKGVDRFLPIITDLNQPALEALIVNLDVEQLMRAIKMACTAEEAKIVDENKVWFEELQKAIEEVQEDEEAEEDEEEAMDEAVKEVVAAAPVDGGVKVEVPKPAPAAPAPAAPPPPQPAAPAPEPGK